MTDMPRGSSIDSAYRHAVAIYGSRPDITGIDIGPEYVNGQPSGRQAIRLHVRIKKPESALVVSEVFPETIGGVPLDVLERSYFPAVEAANGVRRVSETPGAARFQTIQPGIGLSHFADLEHPIAFLAILVGALDRKSVV